MRKILVAILAFSFIGVTPLGAVADTRVTVSPTSKQVLSGSPVTFSAEESAGEFASWANFYFEIERLSGPSADLAIQVRRYNATLALWSTVDSVSNSRRTVVSAAGFDNLTNAMQNTFLKISGVVNEAMVVGVRGWLDVNQNGRRDAFEPSSLQSKVEVLPVRDGRALLDFVFEPPSFNEEQLSAWLFSTGAGVIDPSLLSFQVFESTPYGRQTASGAFVYRSHPQISAYQLQALSVALRYPAIYVAEVLYEVSPGNKVLLASEIFDYQGVGAGKVTTSVFSSDASLRAITGSDKRGFIVDSDVTKVSTEGNQEVYPVSYLLEAQGIDGLPLVGQDVYLYIDTFDLPTVQSLKLNGGSLIAKTNLLDQVLLKRRTDEQGQVRLDFSSTATSVLGEISIDFRLNGLSSYGWGSDSAKRYIAWKEPAPKIQTFSASQGSSNYGGELQLPFSVLGFNDQGIAGQYSALAFTDGPIEIVSPIITGITSSTSTSFKIRLSRLATGSGSSLMTVRLRSEEGEVVEGYWRVDWDSHNFSLAATAITSAPTPTVSFTEVGELASGSLLKIEGAVSNGFGTQVEPLVDEFQVMIKINDETAITQAASIIVGPDGSFVTYLPKRSANFSLSAELFRDQTSIASSECVWEPESGSCTPPPPIQGELGYWTKKLDDNSAKIYAKNVVGAGKVQFMLNGKEIAWVYATSAADSKLREANGSFYLVRTVDLVEGQKNVLEIYLDGVRQTRTAYTY